MSTVALRLPDVGEGLDEAEILLWLVNIGDEVDRDQVVVEVQTDKSAVEIPAPAAGVVESLGGEVGQMLAVGDVLVTIRTSDTAPDEPSEAPDQPSAPAATVQPPTGAPPPARSGGGQVPRRRPMAAPSTRRVALELGVDLTAITGSGPQGRITKDDVERAAGSSVVPAEEATASQGGPTPQSPDTTATSSTRPVSAAPVSAPRIPRPAPEEDRVEPLRGVRRRISETMTAAWRDIPHITDLREVEADGLVEARRTLASAYEHRGQRLTYLPLLVMIIARALRQHPTLNARLDVEAEEITYLGACNIGIATATDQGLIVPVVHGADQLSLTEIVGEIDRLADAARAGKVRPEDTGGGTFTVSNSGSYGSALGTPIIRPPEVGIIGLGRIRDAVVARDGEPVVRTVLPLSAAADHRLIDGHVLGGFVATIAQLVADPVLLLGEVN
jgi:pyruvate dehydrogenase E2 component (dihydrolipoamide acetyltransferase)